MTWCQGTAPKPLWEDGVHTAPRRGGGDPAHETGVRHLRPRPLGASRSQRRPRRFAVGGQKRGVPQHIRYFGEGAVSPQISPEACYAPRPCGRGVGLGSTAGSRRDFLAATTWHEDSRQRAACCAGRGAGGVAGARPGRPRRRSSCRALAVFAFPLVVVWVSLFCFQKRQRAAEGDVFEPSSVHVIPGGPRRRQACRFLGVRLPNGGSPGSGWFSPCWPGAAGTCRDRASDGPQSRRRPEHRDAVLPPARSQPAENSASKSGDAARPRRPAAALLATLPLFLKSFGEACLTE